MSNEVMKSDAFQTKVKTMLGLTYLTRAILDGFNGNHYILKDIYVNSTKNTSQIHYLGWDDPQKYLFILIQIVIVEQLQEASTTKSYLFLMNE